jgi:pimeloyl-ACP methyl ester carboxylesterase
MPPELSAITEPAARDMAARMRREPIPVPSLPVLSGALPTAFVPPSGAHANRAAPPVVMLHGFDSSSLEMRRLHPLLDQQVEAWAVDLVGWGFTDHSVFAGGVGSRWMFEGLLWLTYFCIPHATSTCVYRHRIKINM